MADIRYATGVTVMEDGPRRCVDRGRCTPRVRNFDSKSLVQHLTDELPSGPFSGGGVNIALYDSVQLAEQIAKHGLDELNRAVSEYE